MTTKVPLTQGAYTTRSVIASAQRCVNLFAEVNPKDSETPFTYYPTPGLVLAATGAASQVSSAIIQAGTVGDPTNGYVGPLSGWRGLFQASDGFLYGVCGITLYKMVPTLDDQPGLTLTALGTVSAGPNNRGTPVSMSDNGVTMLIVHSGSGGWQLTLATGAFSSISDGDFAGATRIDYLDTFFVSNMPGTQDFQSSLSNSAAWDVLFFAAKTGYPDKLVTVCCVHREIWLMGEKTTEVWYDVGGALFPFAILPGIFIQHGIYAPYSLAVYDLQTFWLHRDNQGQSNVMMGYNYAARRISTHAIEQAISSYPPSEQFSAIGFFYQQEGHSFYCLRFPQTTWCFDLATEQWHERVWTDGNGAENTWRVATTCRAYGFVYGGDATTGSLYALDLDTYTDNGDPIVRIRGYPHLLADGNRVHYQSFTADIESGWLDPEGADPPALLSLRWSDTRGNSWGNPVIQGLGQGGEYLTQPQWNRLGLARDRVFELSWSVAVKTALNGAFIDVLPLGS